MKSIQPHTHPDRQKMVNKISSQLRRMLGKNLVALAAEGSFARNEDLLYSDLELVAFVKKQPAPPFPTYRQIIKGLLTVVVFETRQSYIEKYLDVGPVWYASGEVNLKPIINAEFIHQIESYKPTDIENKCRSQLTIQWPYFQEIAAKTINSLKLNDKSLFALAYPMMIKQLLILLSYLNQTPYTTLGTYISQAKKFHTTPASFNELIDNYVLQVPSSNSQKIETITKLVNEIEVILEAKEVVVSKSKPPLFP